MLKKLLWRVTLLLLLVVVVMVSERIMKRVGMLKHLRIEVLEMHIRVGRL
jgi:hypothetical protein